MRGLGRIVVALGLLTTTALVRGDESKVALSDVPPAGLAAAKAMFPKAEIVGAAKETDGDKTVYEVTFKEQGRTIDVTIGLEGKIELVEREIAEKELPASVSKALALKYPQASIKLVERVDSLQQAKLELDFYEVLLVTASQQTLEVQITPDGKIKGEEKKPAGDK
jgi:hypothetical protein